ncbi:hypothetical protein HOG21_01905 [bacterium]|nr:hypothetical protein [bacterium]
MSFSVSISEENSNSQLLGTQSKNTSQSKSHSTFVKYILSSIGLFKT